MNTITSDDINSINARHVCSMIQHKKNYNVPYIVTNKDLDIIINDMDHFPYRRFYRDDEFIEREAGFRPRRDRCYKNIFNVSVKKPSLCWEYPCSTFKPCKSKK